MNDIQTHLSLVGHLKQHGETRWYRWGAKAIRNCYRIFTL